MVLMADDINECLKCGDCCKVLDGKGVRVTEQEWDTLEIDICRLDLGNEKFKKTKQVSCLPTKGKYGVKSCLFLGANNECKIYNKRPETCRNFPIWVVERKTIVLFKVAVLCPRAERIAADLEHSLPGWARALVGEKKHNVALV